jgi:hypothetical protein
MFIPLEGIQFKTMDEIMPELEEPSMKHSMKKFSPFAPATSPPLGLLWPRFHMIYSVTLAVNVSTVHQCDVVISSCSSHPGS